MDDLDFTMRVRLADPSLPGGLMINLFAPIASSFPASVLEGCILRACNMEVLGDIPLHVSLA